MAPPSREAPINRLLSLLLMLALVSTFLVAAPSTATALTRADAATESYERDAVAETIAIRLQHQRSKLNTDRCLYRFALRQAKRIANSRTLFHQSLGPVMRKCKLVTAGENIAVGYPTGRSVVDDGWMQSPAHRENLLYPKYQLIAVAAVLGPDGRWYASQVFGRKQR